MKTIYHTHLLSIVFALTFINKSFSQDTLISPSFEQVLSLRSAGNSTISHNGKHVAYSVRQADWESNRYDSEIWISKEGGSPFQLTRTPEGNSSNPQWSPDDQWLAFTATRGNKNQIYVVRIDGGEAFPVTNEKDGVQGYQWSPDGKSLVFTKQQEKPKEKKTKSERYGEYSEDDNEYLLSWLYKIPFDPAYALPSDIPCYEGKDSTYQTWPCIKWPKTETLIDSVDYTIRGYAISPDNKYIVVNHSPDPLINSFMDTDISLLDLSDLSVKTVVSNPSADFAALWSPDSKKIIYTSALDNRTSNYYQNNQVYIYDLADETSSPVAPTFDENIRLVDWNPKGIFATASQKTQVHLYKIDLNNNEMVKLADNPKQFGSVSFSKDGSFLAFSATQQDDLSEIYKSSLANFAPKRISNISQQIDSWKVAQSEVVSWTSKDGSKIEGVLHTPVDFDPGKKYPLLVAIHGGPTGTDRPTPIMSYVYPINQWLNKGAVVLRVNYRGSAGYGAAFRSLNVENLGVGDSWDVLSGVDYVVSRGFVDEEKMGCMGWSQGGYISAFLTTSTDRFKAISVGAGISNWMTYYVNTDIHPFTRQYLKATPWENEEVYKKTSPMTLINNASTPTLIQHGEFDRRVPIANAYELLQGLRDNDVPARLMVYKGFGHGITKPKERLAAVWHNWQWFNKYLWEEEVEMPVGK